MVIRRLTAVGRLTLWFLLLFALAGSTMAIGSYVLTNRAYDTTPRDAYSGIDDLGLPTASPEALAQFRNLLGAEPQVVLERASAKARSRALHQLAWSIGLSFAATLAVAAFGAWWLARRGFRPVRQVTALAQSISATSLHDRIDLVGPDDELKELATTFDNMLARLEQAFDAQRLFSAHVSHELRTPLATMRAEADLITDSAAPLSPDHQLAQVVRSGTTHIDRLVASLSALARAESGFASHSSVDVADIAGQVVTELVGLANHHGVSLDLAVDDATMVGDGVLIRSLLENLVRNAIIHNVDPGAVWIDVRATSDRAIIRVESTGEHVTDAQVDHMLRPFVRGNDDRPISGSGIGTAVIHAVAHAHHGTFAANGRADGGLVAVVELARR
jgi:signal transduction histidine kinase